MSFSKITHHMTRNAETQQYKINRVTPIIRLNQYNEVVLLQGGGFYAPEGQPIKEVPGWVYSAMQNLTPAALDEAGFSEVPKAPKNVSTAPELDKGLFQCEKCGKIMDERSKEKHMAEHNKSTVAQPTAKTETEEA